MAAVWRFGVTLLDGTRVGEVINPRQRNVKLPLNGIPTATFHVDLDNWMADVILQNDILVKAYRNGVLVFHGEDVGKEESSGADGGTLAVNAAGPMFRVMARLIGKGVDPTTGKGVGFASATALLPKARGLIAKDILDVANAEFYTGVNVGTLADTATGYAGPWFLKKAGEAIIEMSAALLDGYDFEVVPEEASGSWPNLRIGTFKTYASMGSVKPNAILEYGTGLKNMREYKRAVDKSRRANRAYGPPPGTWPDSSTLADTLLSSQDATSINAVGLWEDVITGDLASPDFRAALAQENVRVRKNPRQQIFFTPVIDATPQPLVDYFVGDIITARAVVNNVVRFNALFRVYGLEFGVDDEGQEEDTITLTFEA